MPRHTQPYPFARNQCDYCGQVFPTRTGVRRHIGHSPRCQAIALRNVSKSDQGAEGLTDEDSEANGQGVHTTGADHTNSGPEVDMDPDILLGHEAGLDNDSDSAHAQRYAREYDEGPVANVLGSEKTAFETMKDLQEASGQSSYAPFKDRSEWELAAWLVKNVNQRATDEYLKLPIVSHIQP